MRVEAAYLEQARKTKRYFPFVAVEGGRVWGFAEGTLQFHPTRGTAMRIQFVYGPDKALRPFLVMFRSYAEQLKLCAIYLESSLYHPELSTAARLEKFHRIEGEVPMRWRNTHKEPLAVPGMTVRTMRADEYLGIRGTILKYVSRGPYVSNEPEVLSQLESGLYHPMVAIIDGQMAAYAELALIHAGIASCLVGRVERVVVDVPFRGRHLSQHLVGELLRKAGGFGCTHVNLTVAQDNISAAKTYERLGFLRTGVIPYCLAL